MQQETLEAHLSALPLGAIRYYDTVGSTNDLAAAWARQGAPELALLIADEQTAGRGRGQRKWFTPPGAALAFSLILRPESETISRATGLGALGVCQALQQRCHLPAEIKWPNDVIAHGKKLAGILTEASWVGDRLSALILGIGVNVTPSAVPPDGWSGHHDHPFPATSVTAESGQSIQRLDLLHRILELLLTWLPDLESPRFLQAWTEALAFRDEWVWVFPSDESSRDTPVQGKILGLRADGALRLETQPGEEISIRSGEVHLRPVDSLGK